MWRWAAAVKSGRRLFLSLFFFLFFFSFLSFHPCLRGKVEFNETHLHLHILAYFTGVLLLYQRHCSALVSTRRLLRPCHQEPRTCGCTWFGKPRCVWFVYVGAPSSTFHSVIFRLYMSLSATFMSPLIPPRTAQGRLWTAMQVALCIKHTATGHRYHYYHPRPPLREINNLRASRNTLRHMLMGSLTLQTLLFLIFVFLLLGGDMRAHLHETQHLSRGRVRVDLLLHPPPSGLCSREYIFEMTK